MRPGQQNNSNNNNNNNNKNRSRGRNNNNGGRKHLNPLSRNYESNGPDVKVRGNAAHVAEKYVQLARDAHGSGDSVMAENYLQHAEHYFRIVLASQPQGAPRTDQFGQEYDGDAAEGDDYAGDEHSRCDTPAYRANLQNDRSDQDDRQPRAEQPQPVQPPQADRPQQRDERQPRFEPVRAEQQQVTDPAADVETQDAGGEAGGDAPAAPDAEPRRARERRPRRRRPASGEAGAIDPAGPQPDIGDLPAFITAGGTPNPAE